MRPFNPARMITLLLVTGLFTVAVLESKAYQLAKTDFFQLAPPYHDYLKNRYKYIAQMRHMGQRYLVVEDYPQEELPRSIFLMT